MVLNNKIFSILFLLNLQKKKKPSRLISRRIKSFKLELCNELKLTMKIIGKNNLNLLFLTNSNFKLLQALKNYIIGHVNKRATM